MAELQIKDVMQAVDELRSTVETKDSNLAENKERIDKLNEALEKQEKMNETVTVELQQKKNADVELKEQLENLEKAISRPNLSALAKEEKKHKKRFEKESEKLKVKG